MYDAQLIQVEASGGEKSNRKRKRNANTPRYAVAPDAHPIVAPSTIPGAGQGLFADRDYLPGEIIAEYGGKILTGDEARYVDSDYLRAGDLLGTWVIDGKDRLVLTLLLYEPSSESLGKYINDAKGSGQAPNVMMVADQVNKKIFVKVGSRGVCKGEEFFVRYGAGYWASKRRRLLKGVPPPPPPSDRLRRAERREAE